ncbi:MAG: Rieske 2Fe-2S domain-containing protein [Proteobacteria bacterium]|nr:Rieske 2Fe-2S domain-containing protein [Pseudomonadota bacterium]
MAQFRVAKESEIPDGRGLRVRVGRVEIGLYRVDGEIFAMEDLCPHAGYPLHEGDLDGPVVTCPQHLWQFDVRTGMHPGESDGWPIPCFPIRVVDGEVWIDVQLPDEDPT